MSASQTAAITAFGLVTPLGNSADETWEALLGGGFITDHARCRWSGEAAGRAISLARVAAGETARGSYDAIGDSETALVVGTSKGPVEQWLSCAGVDGTPPLRLAGLGDIAASLAGELGMTGPRLTVSAACASGLHALIRASLMIRSGEARRALVVAVESSLNPLFVASFRRLGVLPAEGVGCRPFDQGRDGFLMSEAAAAVWVESPDEARGAREPRPVLIDGMAMAGDATHLTNSDPRGRTLRRVVGRVIDGRPVDLVHAHATGTLAHDAVELAALDECCGGQVEPPALYSHKGALGHSLGASGLVSVVINCLCHRHGVVPPNVRTTRPLATRHARLSRERDSRVVRRSLALAAGFGGPTAAVSLRSL